MELLDYKSKYQNDIILEKEIIKKKLLNNEPIMDLLLRHAQDGQEDLLDYDDLFDTVILPYHLVTPVEAETRSFLCYEIQWSTLSKENYYYKELYLAFYILIHTNHAKDDATGIATHDLLSALVEDEFNHCEDFGTQLNLISNDPRPVDNRYLGRLLTFKQTTLNGIVRDGRVIVSGLSN